MSVYIYPIIFLVSPQVWCILVYKLGNLSLQKSLASLLFLPHFNYPSIKLITIVQSIFILKLK